MSVLSLIGLFILLVGIVLPFCAIPSSIIPLECVSDAFKNVFNYSSFTNKSTILSLSAVILSGILLISELLLSFFYYKKKLLSVNAVLRAFGHSDYAYLVMLYHFLNLNSLINVSSLLFLIFSTALVFSGNLLLSLPLYQRKMPWDKKNTEIKILKEDDIQKIVKEESQDNKEKDECNKKTEEIQKRLTVLEEKVKELESKMNNNNSINTSFKEKQGETKDDDKTMEPAHPEEKKAEVKKKAAALSFKDRLERLDPDLKNKYEGLNKALLNEGLHLRISKGGATYSLHRLRYAFLMVAGNHLKLFLRLNSGDYKETALPLVSTRTKAKSDLPSYLIVKSDLSYKRALSLIADLEIADKAHK